MIIYDNTTWWNLACAMIKRVFKLYSCNILFYEKYK